MEIPKGEMPLHSKVGLGTLPHDSRHRSIYTLAQPHGTARPDEAEDADGRTELIHLSPYTWCTMPTFDMMHQCIQSTDPHRFVVSLFHFIHSLVQTHWTAHFSLP